MRGRSEAGTRTNKNVTFSTPDRNNDFTESAFRESRFSPLKSTFLKESSPLRRQLVLRLEDEDELIRAMRESISYERELETAKTSLVMKPDFNLFDAFRIFDVDSRGWIS